MVGRLAPPKRPDLALRALAARAPDAELQIVGDGPLQAGAERLAAELGVAERVRFLGHRDDVPELLARAECALLASDYEGSPAGGRRGDGRRGRRSSQRRPAASASSCRTA